MVLSIGYARVRERPFLNEQPVWNSSKDMCEQFSPEERGNRKMFQSSTLSDSVSEETSRQIGMAQVRRHLVRFSCQTYDCTCFCTWFLCLSSAYLSETKGNKEPEQFWKRAGCKFKGIYIHNICVCLHVSLNEHVYMHSHVRYV